MRNVLATMVLAGLTGVALAADQPHASLLVEAEQFQFSGGWRIGTDSQAGGGRLLAVPGRSDNQPGVPPDRPVHDALTLVAFPISGEYRIWARARDYTTFPGKRRFTITVDDRALSGEAGHHGRDGWAWQELGSLRIESGDRLVGLRDTTRFFGRCDAVFFTTTGQDPAKLSASQLAQFRVTPVVADTSRSRLFRPDKLSGDRPTTVAKLENGLTRIEFELHRDFEGRPLVVRRTAVRVGEAWQSVAGVGEGEVLFLLYAATCEAELKSMPRWSTPEYRVELDVAGKKIEAAGATTDPFQPGTGARFRPVAARQTSPNTVTVEYELVGEKGLVKHERATGTFTLAAASREVQLELVLEPARTGFYSAGIGGFRSWSAEEIPAWQVSPIGLGLEQPSTYTAFASAMNNILMSCWAPHLLRVYQHSGCEIYRTCARNSILGRFANYPGYCEPICVRPEADAAAIGLVDGPVRVYESAALPPSLPAPALQGKEGVVPRQTGVVSEVTVPPKGLAAISWPAECREAMARVPPLEKGHVVTDLAGWGKLHAFRIRSPFGSDAVFVVLVSDPVDGATARLNAHIRSGEKQLTISEFPYEFSLDRVEMDEDVPIEFTISGAKGRPERSARLSLPGGRG